MTDLSAAGFSARFASISRKNVLFSSAGSRQNDPCNRNLNLNTVLGAGLLSVIRHAVAGADICRQRSN
jgi:hypothetical protein